MKKSSPQNYTTQRVVSSFYGLFYGAETKAYGKLSPDTSTCEQDSTYLCHHQGVSGQTITTVSGITDVDLEVWLFQMLADAL